MAATRWGIAGCGVAASDFATALKHEGRSKHVVVAVSDHFGDNAEKFAKKFGVNKVYESYEALAEDPDIDVVYIAVFNPMHFKLVKIFLESRKPVLCEKPMTARLTDTRQLVELARRQKTFLMEGLWSRFFPVYRELQRRLDSGEVGQVTHAFVTMGRVCDTDPRIVRKELGGGYMFDVGPHSIQFILCAMGDEKPLEIKAMGTLNEEGLEGDVCCSLRFSNDRFATIVLSTKCTLPNSAFITGTKGTITLETPYWSSSSMSGPAGDFKAPLDPSELQYLYPNGQGFKYEAAEVARCVKEGETESPLMPHSTSLLVIEIIEAVRQQLGATVY